MLREERLHARPLHPDAAAVDEAHLAKASRRSLSQIFLDDRTHVLWTKGVEIEGVLDGKMDGLRLVHDALRSAREGVHDRRRRHEVRLAPPLLPRLRGHALEESPVLCLATCLD